MRFGSCRVTKNIIQFTNCSTQFQFSYIDTDSLKHQEVVVEKRFCTLYFFIDLPVGK